MGRNVEHHFVKNFIVNINLFQRCCLRLGSIHKVRMQKLLFLTPSLPCTLMVDFIGNVPLWPHARPLSICIRTLWVAPDCPPCCFYKILNLTNTVFALADKKYFTQSALPIYLFAHYYCFHIVANLSIT